MGKKEELTGFAKLKHAVENHRILKWLLFAGASVIALAAVIAAFKTIKDIIPQPYKPKFEIVETPDSVPSILEQLKKGQGHRLVSPPATDQTTLTLPPFRDDTEVWLEATTTATGHSQESMAGVTILYDGKPLVQRDSPRHAGPLSVTAIMKIKVSAGNALEFGIDGADHLAFREKVTFAAYSMALP